MISPYYQDEAVTIYHGDCREILPNLPKVDLVLTDPPYGIGRSGQEQTVCVNPRHNRKEYVDYSWDTQRPNKVMFDLIFSAADNHIIWGGNYFTQYLPPSMGWIVWDKGQDFSTSDCELAFTSYDKALRRVICNRGAINLEGACHPTQKPLKVIKFCLMYAENTHSILDPFLGSGTTAVAAKQLNRKCIGIEIEERYCEIAANRCRQMVMELAC